MKVVGLLGFVVVILIACGPTTAAGRDGCADPDSGQDYCGTCKATGKCDYCATGTCVADPCKCGSVAAITCGNGTHAENGVCVLGAPGSGTSGSPSSSGGDVGLPCSTGAHPAWEANECTAPTSCKLCSIRSCVRATAQGCCGGEDTPSEFFPCNGCGNCAGAVQAALTRCGCD